MFSIYKAIHENKIEETETLLHEQMSDLGRAVIKVKILQKKNLLIEANDLLVNLKQKPNDASIDTLLFYEQYASVKWQLGEHDVAKSSIKKFEYFLDKMDVQDELIRHLHADVLTLKGAISLAKSKLKKSEEYFHKSLEIKKALDDQRSVASILNNLAIISIQRGDYWLALKYFEECKSFFSSINEQGGLAYIYNNMGGIYLTKGNLVKALDSFLEAYGISKTLNNEILSSKIQNNIGNIYLQQGEIDQALNYYELSLEIKKKFGLEIEAIPTMHNLGMVCQKKGEYYQAINYYLNSLSLATEFENPIQISNTLAELIQVYLEINDIDKAKDALSRLETLNFNNNNGQINLFYQFGCALILKYSRLKGYLSDARRILEEIVNDKIINYEITKVSIIHLCELKIDEYLKSYENKILLEIFDMIQILYKNSQEQNDREFLIRSLILLARLQKLKSNSKHAQLILAQSHLLALEFGLLTMVKQIEETRRFIHTPITLDNKFSFLSKLREEIIELQTV